MIAHSRYRRTYGTRGQLKSDMQGQCPLYEFDFVSCIVYDNVTELQQAFPASENSSSFGLAYFNSLPLTYQSNGTRWNSLCEEQTGGNDIIGGGSISDGSNLIVDVGDG